MIYQSDKRHQRNRTASGALGVLRVVASVLSGVVRKRPAEKVTIEGSGRVSYEGILKESIQGRKNTLKFKQRPWGRTILGV